MLVGGIPLKLKLSSAPCSITVVEIHNQTMNADGGAKRHRVTQTTCRSSPLAILIRV
jgi:hypothetical protein